jgi:predicted TIM-barrel fold metal-dependent hydrolase
MALRFGVVSVDDHVVESPDVWTKRLSKAKFGDKIPQIVRGKSGADEWVVDGKPIGLPGVALAGAAMRDRVEEPQRWEDVPKIASVPAERLKAMDLDRVDVSVLYPNVAGIAGETFGKVADPALELACVQAYNDWLVDDWAKTSPRFIPQCIIPIAPIDAAVAEIKRAVAKGHRGIVMPAIPMHLKDVPHINEPVYDPIWKTASDLGVPICFHAGSSKRIQFPAYKELTPGLAAALEAMTRPVSSVIIIANFLFSKILLRYPNLKVVMSESSLTWVAYVVETADHQFERQRLHLEGYAKFPSQMAADNCYFTGWYDRTGIETRHSIGVNNILWATEFPLGTSSWPSSKDFIGRAFEGVPEDEKNQILVVNASELYKISA